ncbi:hypothetical protein bcgnr5390_10730 [Bacillus luti]|nr:hypothetical protein BC2903_30170 [Bacillus cereus]
MKKKLIEDKWSERVPLQEHLDWKAEEEAKKRKKENIFYSFVLLIILMLLVFGLQGCVSSLHEAKVEKAHETIEKCDDHYEVGNVDGKTCDDARKVYNNYSEKEWREKKKQLIDFEDITEHDQLYDELKREIVKDRAK